MPGNHALSWPQSLCRTNQMSRPPSKGTRSNLPLRRWISSSNTHPLPPPPRPYVVYIDRCITATAKQNKTKLIIISWSILCLEGLLSYCILGQNYCYPYETAIELTKSTRFHTIFHACYIYGEPDYVIYVYNICGY